MSTKPKFLLISDVRDWAFDQNMHDLEQYLKSDLDITHGYVAEWFKAHAIPNMDCYDGVFALYHRWNIEEYLPMKKTLGTLRAQWMFPENKNPPGQLEFDLVNSYAAYHVVNQHNYDQYREHCPRLYYITNPVNTKRFPVATPPRDRVVCSWNGNAGHSNSLNEDVKGFYSIITKACRLTRTPLEYAEYHLNRKRPSEMPLFYQNANVTLCASLYEGASSSVMEAMACGHALVATDVGNHREMYESQLAEYGESGIMLVERSVRAFAQAVRKLSRDPELVVRMGELNRKEIERAWSWAAWRDRYLEFMMKAMENNDA